MSAPWSTARPIGVLGTGSALPGDPVETGDLIRHMEDQFGLRGGRVARAVAGRMGIAARHLARSFAAREELPRSGQSNAELAADAIRRALDDAGSTVGEIAYLIGHTTTPGQLLPGNVAEVADRLGYAGPHIELRQACTGFANALMVASGLLAASDRPIVIVGSETGSLFFDPCRANDDSGQLVNMVQMGDGAGAIVLGSVDRARAQISAAWFGAIGLGRAPGISLAQGAREFTHDFGTIRATGHALFDAGRDAAEALGHDLAAADWIIPHQVSGRIGALVADRFGLPLERMIVQADRLGNTGSAAIWLALDAVRRGIATPGQSALILGAEASKHMYGGFAYRHG
jgi:3-oxoacyl-[acyl-carrier-protein] synthase-3